jgi:hypothetical protein
MRLGFSYIFLRSASGSSSGSEAVAGFGMFCVVVRLLEDFLFFFFFFLWYGSGSGSASSRSAGSDASVSSEPELGWSLVALLLPPLAPVDLPT